MAFPRTKTSTAARGYGAAHQRARRVALAQLAAAGSGTCAEIVCLMSSRIITPGMALDLAHDRSTGGYRGLAHSLCNRREGQQQGGRVTSRKRQPTRTSRDWL